MLGALKRLLGVEARRRKRLEASLRAITNRSGAQARLGAGLGLQGNLTQTPLHDLLQFLALGKKTGQLEVVSGRRMGRIRLRGGKIAGESYRGKEGLEAIFLMLDLEAGDFEFHDNVEGGPSPGRELEVIDVLMLWMGKSGKKNLLRDN